MEHWEEEGKIRKSFYFELPLWILSFIYMLVFGLSINIFFLFASLILITAEDLIYNRKSKVGYITVISILLFGLFKYFIVG